MDTKQVNEMKYLPVQDIFPNPRNPQTMKKAEFDRLCDEIANNGFLVPIQVTPREDGKFMIVGGEHRWRAAVVNQMTDIPCMILIGSKWEDDDLIDFVTVRLNAISGKIDPEKFMKLYQDKVSKYGAEALGDLFGYVDSHAFQRLIGDTKRGIKKGLPKDMHKEFDEMSKEAKTAQDLSDIVQKLFVKYGDTVEKSFMILAYGGVEHLYIQMSRDMKKQMDRVVQYAKLSGKELNDLMAPIIKTAMDQTEKAMEGLEK